MTMPMDMHEHGSSDKKGIFVNTCVLPLGHTLETQNCLPQFLLKLFSRFHAVFRSLLTVDLLRKLFQYI